MTYKALQDRALARLNLTSSPARTRIKNHLNERNRRLATSVGLSRVRRGPVSVNTVADTATITSTGVVKVLGITIPAHDRTLVEQTINQIRLMDPAESTEGVPWFYAVQRDGATAQIITLYPTPDDVYALSIDGVLTGTDMSNDADVPAFPEDFHDALLFGALADEYAHMGEMMEGERFDQKYEQRCRDLRYFMAKTAFLARRQGGHMDMPFWWPASGHWVA